MARKGPAQKTSLILPCPTPSRHSNEPITISSGAMTSPAMRRPLSVIVPSVPNTAPKVGVKGLPTCYQRIIRDCGPNNTVNGKPLEYSWSPATGIGGKGTRCALELDPLQGFHWSLPQTRWGQWLSGDVRRAPASPLFNAPTLIHAFVCLIEPSLEPAVLYEQSLVHRQLGPMAGDGDASRVYWASPSAYKND